MSSAIKDLSWEPNYGDQRDSHAVDLFIDTVSTTENTEENTDNEYNCDSVPQEVKQMTVQHQMIECMNPRETVLFKLVPVEKNAKMDYFEDFLYNLTVVYENYTKNVKNLRHFPQILTMDEKIPLSDIKKKWFTLRWC